MFSRDYLSFSTGLLNQNFVEYDQNYHHSKYSFPWKIDGV